MDETLVLPAALLLAGAASDLRTRTIPDVAPIAMASTGAAHLALTAGLAALGAATACAAAAFAAGAALFHLRQIGGGDVKLVAALAFWLPADRWPAFLLVTAVSGGLVCLAAAMARFLAVARAQGAAAGLVAARAATAPYAVAICVGGLAALPWSGR